MKQQLVHTFAILSTETTQLKRHNHRIQKRTTSLGAAFRFHNLPGRNRSSLHPQTKKGTFTAWRRGGIDDCWSATYHTIGTTRHWLGPRPPLRNVRFCPKY